MPPTTAPAPAVPAGGEAAAPRRFDMAFTPDPIRVGQLRRITAARLQSWEVPELIDDVTLVISELVTNAVCHAGTGPGNLTVTHVPGSEVRIEVSDRSPVTARLMFAVDTDESGRGLATVQHIATNWGVRSEGDSKTVWAAIAAPGEKKR